MRKRFSLNCTYHTVTDKRSGQVYYKLYISKDQQSLVNSLVLPYMIPSMLYKLHI